MRRRAMVASLMVLMLSWTAAIPAVAAGPDGPATRGAEDDSLALSRVDLPADLPEDGLQAVVAGGPGYIAVGTSYDLDYAEVPVIVTSVDGRSWERVTLTGDAELGSLWDIAAFDGGYAAVGGLRTEMDVPGVAAVWLSEDGLDWRQVEPSTDSWPGELGAVTGWQGGLFGLDTSRGIGWTSPDGETWTRAGPIDPRGPALAGVGSSPDHLFAVGVTDAYGSGLVFASTDGTDWTERIVDATSTLHGVAVVGDDIIAAGELFTEDPNPDQDATGSWGVSNGLALISTDGGATWEEVYPTAEVEGASFRGVSAGPGGAIAFGSTRDGKAGAWILGDDRTWSQVPDDGSADAKDASISDMVPTADGTGAVAVGGVGWGPAAWIIGPALDEPVATPRPTRTPRPRVTPRPTSRPTAAPAANVAAERYLIKGVSPRVRDTCEPKRDGNPEGTVAAILCEPDVPGIQRVGYYLMSVKDAWAVFRERRDTYLGSRRDPGCGNGKPGSFDEVGWTGTGICYLDEEGRPNVRVVEYEDNECHPGPVTLGGTVIRQPTVYTGVLGTGSIRRLFFAWLEASLGWRYPDGTGPTDPDSVGGVSCPAPWPR